MKKIYIQSLLFLLLFLNSCSYRPNVTQVSEERLADYNPKHFQAKVSRGESVDTQMRKFPGEDTLIMKAIVYEQQGDFKKSNDCYAELYRLTGKKEYMIREMRSSLYLGKEIQNIKELESLVESHPENLQVKRLLLSFYMNEKMYDKAKKTSKLLISQSSNAMDLELSANPYFMTEDYRESINILTQVYEKRKNPETLLKITTILANYMKNTDEAVLRLEKHRVSVGFDERVSLQLVEIYSNQKKIDNLLIIYKDLYRKTKKREYGRKVVEGYMYQKEADKAIDFLTNEYLDNEFLYELYVSQKHYLKAKDIAQKNYESSFDAKWLAESAMALYEGTQNKDDSKMLSELVEKFDKALNEGARDAVYLNSYGYALINQNVNIEKGVKLIEEALLKDKNNTFYLDSLAWGYYKQNRCQEAQIAIDKVVKVEGLKDDDIRKHWEKIEACNRDK